MKTIVTQSEEETRTFGERLARTLKEKRYMRSYVLALTGELGAGKTSFSKGFAKGLGVKKPITSPTFLIVRSYRIKEKRRVPWNMLYHIDCYRLSGPEDLDSIDWEGIISHPFHIVLVEWAEKVRGKIPGDAIWISFRVGSPNKRNITIRSREHIPKNL